MVRPDEWYLLLPNDVNREIFLVKPYDLVTLEPEIPEEGSCIDVMCTSIALQLKPALTNGFRFPNIHPADKTAFNLTGYEIVGETEICAELEKIGLGYYVPVIEAECGIRAPPLTYTSRR
ncbi:hypothetical protein HYU11_06415 [Candidatus Woesearchaeota archaeon]|nr:hypothetical protein [Candidatus Woesearchaeota archaeon]